MLVSEYNIASGCQFAWGSLVVRFSHINSWKMAETTGVSCSNPNAEVVRGQVFEAGPRYTNLAYIGEGAYGMVV